jgi:two-component system sensor histidine kinase PilS (NtrC family)
MGITIVMKRIAMRSRLGVIIQMQDNKNSIAKDWLFWSRKYTPPSQESLWRSIYYFNLYRLILSSLLVFLFGSFGSALALIAHSLRLFYDTSVVYVILAVTFQLAIRLRKPKFSVQLAVQVSADIICVTLLMYAGGGIQSGLGILLLMSLAATGLISRGRITLFFAALASIAILLEHSYAVLTQNDDAAQFVQAGLLSIAYFAVALMAHTLARYAVASEKLATQRGTELASMAEANRLVIEGMPDGVLVVDERGVIRQFNPSAERLTGCNIPMSGRDTLESCMPILADLFATWRKDQSSTPKKVQFPATGYSVRVRFLPVQHGDFLGALVFLEDTQRIQAQAQQIKLAALGRLTASVAHEIRNPLSAISYAAELFEEEEHSPEQGRLIQIILDNTSRLEGIVQDVMQLNRRDRVRPETLKLAAILPKFAEEICQSKHMSPDIIQLNVESECTVNFDRGHFFQILWNLCSNALRYCRKQTGSVQLSSRQSESESTILEVFNDGEEIKPEMVQQLFEPFFTSDPSGTGLGLYIARELSEANGARLEYVQQAQGGVCFRITFGGH